MHSSDDAFDAPHGQTRMDFDQNRFRDVMDALDEVVNQEDFPRTDVQRLELGFQANGEVTWKAWTVDRDEAYGGWLPEPEGE